MKEFKNSQAVTEAFEALIKFPTIAETINHMV